MGEIVVIVPKADVLQFAGAAQRTVDALFDEMVIALRRVSAAATACAGDRHGEFLVAQRQLANARRRLEWLHDAMTFAHRDRDRLWSGIPSDQSRTTAFAHVPAMTDAPDCVIVMSVRRNGMTLVADSLNVFERDGDELMMCA